MSAPVTEELLLEPADNRVLANLCGQRDEHLRQIERRLGVQIGNRGNHFRVIGPERSVRLGGRLLRELFALAGREQLDPQRLHVLLQDAAMDERAQETMVEGEAADTEVLHTRRSHIRPRGPNQRAYIASIRKHDLCFGIGPAGTGKTYLAVASAVEALEQERVRRIVLVRPAVEAGERLGFLPGDLAQKVDPYLRPMYDALYEMLGFDRVARFTERNLIEVAPLAYMRGRSLNESFIILDEAQNTTVEQMKMFLTRMGFGSQAVVTGDITQVDLPRRQVSGLRHVMQVLQDVAGVGFTFFSPRDVVRHALVQRIVEAYEAAERAETAEVAAGTDTIDDEAPGAAPAS
ncbi:MAG: PhoH family protein [Gammaproteobacteria bacterium]|nr:PhoH family protein [Gammaproteobacteria bacterium]